LPLNPPAAFAFVVAKVSSSKFTLSAAFAGAPEPVKPTDDPTAPWFGVIARDSGCVLAQNTALRMICLPAAVQPIS